MWVGDGSVWNNKIWTIFILAVDLIEFAMV